MNNTKTTAQRFTAACLDLYKKCLGIDDRHIVEFSALVDTNPEAFVTDINYDDNAGALWLDQNTEGGIAVIGVHLGNRTASDGPDMKYNVAISSLSAPKALREAGARLYEYKYNVGFYCQSLQNGKNAYSIFATKEIGKFIVWTQRFFYS